MAERRPPRRGPLIDWLAERVKVDDNGCWLWVKSLDDKGYGTQAKVDGRRLRPHQLAWELLVGPIPEGLELDHLCRVRRCCCVDHLEPVTHKVNLSRGDYALRTHCPQGHPYDEANTYINPRGARECRTCRAERVRAFKAKRKAA